MTHGPLLIHGGILIDDLTFADGRTMNGVAGGAALHALAGAALWDDDVLLIGGVGQDADQDILPWMRESGLSTAGLRIADPRTPRNIFIYLADGSRTETPAYGVDHFARLQPGADALVSRFPGARGAYVFHDADSNFWQSVLQGLGTHRIPLLWEPWADACTPQHRSDIKAIASRIAAVSLNWQEAAAIFRAQSRESLIEGLRNLGAGVVYLRCADKGSLVIHAQACIEIPAYAAEVVDVTGAGNAYGGGALAGLVQSADPVRAGHMGAIAAQSALRQYGLFAPRDTYLRAGAQVALNATLAHSFAPALPIG